MTGREREREGEREEDRQIDSYEDPCKIFAHLLLPKAGAQHLQCGMEQLIRSLSAK